MAEERGCSNAAGHQLNGRENYYNQGKIFRYGFGQKQRWRQGPFFARESEDHYLQRPAQEISLRVAVVVIVELRFPLPAPLIANDLK